jgi:hypothetical protein
MKCRAITMYTTDSLNKGLRCNTSDRGQISFSEFRSSNESKDYMTRVSNLQHVRTVQPYGKDGQLTSNCD